MSIALHTRTFRLPEIDKQDRAWWIEFLWLTGIFDTTDISEIMEMDEHDVCAMLYDAREPR